MNLNCKKGKYNFVLKNTNFNFTGKCYKQKTNEHRAGTHEPRASGTTCTRPMATAAAREAVAAAAARVSMRVCGGHTTTTLYHLPSPFETADPEPSYQLGFGFSAPIPLPRFAFCERIAPLPPPPYLHDPMTLLNHSSPLFHLVCLKLSHSM